MANTTGHLMRLCWLYMARLTADQKWALLALPSPRETKLTQSLGNVGTPRVTARPTACARPTAGVHWEARVEVTKKSLFVPPMAAVSAGGHWVQGGADVAPCAIEYDFFDGSAALELSHDGHCHMAVVQRAGVCGSQHGPQSAQQLLPARPDGVEALPHGRSDARLHVQQKGRETSGQEQPQVRLPQGRGLERLG
eukprot:CAMPEP_0173171650 /NCGR_PEP_ID=MMETSP1141-20130122/1877_1 /TAXON_ID=483371 /ORGANISM="non described non described, Strain CCMP2298" /LENGTH=194 /DNA_ID=CAMNT_0014093611 /DNA_START=323 /DNA_END=906 /DNA_ORIENTATION=+